MAVQEPRLPEPSLRPPYTTPAPGRLRRPAVPVLTGAATALVLLAVQFAFGAERDSHPRLGLDLTVSAPVAAEGEVLTAVVRLVVADTGPGERVTVAGTLSGGLHTVGADASRGGFDAPSGVWTVPSAPGTREAVLLWRIQAAGGAADAVEHIRVAVTSPRTHARSVGASGSPSGKPAVTSATPAPVTTSAPTTPVPTATAPSPPTVAVPEVDVPVAQRCPDDPAAACADLRFGKPRLSLVRAVDATDSRPGETLMHTVSVTDSGDAAALFAGVRNSVPAGAPLLWGALSQGSYDATTGVWQTGRIAAGGTATLTLAVRVPDPAAGTVMSARSDFVMSSDPAPAVEAACPDDPDSSCASTRIGPR
ncbi:hypothetical protein [Yinghuangia seranimata]|uniref:hypothetical protein n=1 Tax=Yinghuangia seranimata TaxID=408067 RepID=UPI00248C235D|nr:hypothetical protein [Yinghuangia seranimata]MDI2132959.1 hypothetical protein [Yinghuangia seranimata]